MAYGDLTRVRHVATVSTAITVLQLKASATAGFEILRWWVNQKGSVTSVQESIQLVVKSAAATVTTAVAGTHVFKTQGSGAPTTSLQLGTAATGVIASAEGTDGDILDEMGFNVLSGYEWNRTHEGHLVVPAGAFGNFRPTMMPASQSWRFGMDIKELGT
jgi:hypothetical protein